MLLQSLSNRRDIEGLSTMAFGLLASSAILLLLGSVDVAAAVASRSNPPPELYTINATGVLPPGLTYCATETCVAVTINFDVVGEDEMSVNGTEFGLLEVLGDPYYVYAVRILSTPILLYGY